MSAGCFFVGHSNIAFANILYPDFASPAGLSLVGSATPSSGLLRLNPSSIDQKGAAWVTIPQQLNDGFESEFEFRISSPAGVTHPLGYNGADGFAFVIQNQNTSAIGVLNNIGYDDITNSLAVEFDTWANIGGITGLNLGDPGVANHVSIHTRGAAPNSLFESASLGMTTSIPNIRDGLIHRAKLSYVPGTLTVFIDNLVVPALVTPLSLTNLAGDNILDSNGRALVGFTGGTGGAFENHDIINWSLTTTPEPSTVAILAIAGFCLRLNRRGFRGSK